MGKWVMRYPSQMYESKKRYSDIERMEAVCSTLISIAGSCVIE